MDESKKIETVEVDGDVYEVTGRDDEGKINRLKRFNQKMWVNLKFDNSADVERINEWAANLLCSKRRI